MTDKSMMLINGGEFDEQGGYSDTFKLIPILMNCPYNEAIYDTAEKVLFVVSKEKKNNLHKLSNKTDVVIEKYYEYHITTHGEIVTFIKMFCANNEGFDYLRYMN